MTIIAKFNINLKKGDRIMKRLMQNIFQKVDYTIGNNGKVKKTMIATMLLLLLVACGGGSNNEEPEVLPDITITKKIRITVETNGVMWQRTDYEEPEFYINNNFCAGGTVNDLMKWTNNLTGFTFTDKLGLGHATREEGCKNITEADWTGEFKTICTYFNTSFDAHSPDTIGNVKATMKVYHDDKLVFERTKKTTNKGVLKIVYGLSDGKWQEGYTEQQYGITIN